MHTKRPISYARGYMAMLIMAVIGLLPGLVGCRTLKVSMTPSPEPVPVISTVAPTVIAPPVATRVGVSPDSAMRAQEWLRGEPCKPPCWEGITPGVSTVTDTLNIFRRSPFVNTWKIYDAAKMLRISGVGIGSVDWYGRDGSIGGSVQYRLDQRVIAVWTDYPRGGLTLQRVIDAYGPPSHVYAWANPSSDGTYTVYGLQIVYLPRGFALAWTGSPDNVHKPDFDGSWDNFSLVFFVPTPAGFADAHGNPSAAAGLVPWRGMLGFDAYCQGSSCVQHHK